MNSQPLYPNQPLAEVATEIRFRGELAVEAERHRFQQLVRGDYPNLFVPQAQPGMSPPLQHFRFERDDREAGVQLAINSFSFYMREYPGADSFIEEALTRYEALAKLLPPLNIVRVGWRYINAIPFARESGFVPLNRYFRKDMYFGEAMYQRCEQVGIVLTGQLETCRFSLAIQSARSKHAPEEEVLLLDTDAYLKEEDLQESDSPADVGSHVHSAHTAARGLFEHLITDDYREFLKGEPDA